MSNETPKPNPVKTKSAPKSWIFASIAVVAVLLPFFVSMKPTATLRVGERSYVLNIAASKASQEKGLGGRESLAQDRGMLFVFKAPATQCFWMKDMQFPLDIIWLNSTKQVTYVAANVTPATYPQQYCGDASTKYVVELNAGEAKRAGLIVGQQVSL